MSVYLDMCATTPVATQVLETMQPYFCDEFGNAGSRTHEHGQRAAKAVAAARKQIAEVFNADSSDVIFTSGATEANNLAILGLTQHGLNTGKQHIISTQIEHKAVLEPLEEMERRGFKVTLIPPNRDGIVSAEKILSAIRPDTLLISAMHANNETGALQPISEIADGLNEKEILFHVDAAQSFGKLNTPLQHQRIDLISASGHKVFGPKGIGCLLTRTRDYERPPLQPIMFGGGQERKLRPGTLPVSLIVGFGKAVELAAEKQAQRWERCLKIRREALDALNGVPHTLNTPLESSLPHVLNVTFHGIDSEALMIMLKGTAEISNGSACTSTSYQPSHVLKVMGLTDDEANKSIRISWSSATPSNIWSAFTGVITPQ